MFKQHRPFKIRILISINKKIYLLYIEITHRLTGTPISVQYKRKIASTGGEKMNKNIDDNDIDIELDFDFTPIGLAIKKAREAKKITRERLVENLGISTRHLQSVENEGQFPSFKLFIKLITMFDVSVDQYIFSDREAEKSSARRRLDSLLDTLDDKDLSIIEATAYSRIISEKKATKNARFPQ